VSKPSRLPPLQTGRADFPQPAYPKAFGGRHASGDLAVPATHSSVWRCMPRHTLVGASSMNHATPLPRVRFRQGPFAPPALPGFLTTTTPSDSCSGPSAVIDSRDRSRWTMCSSPPEQVSQVPDRPVDARCPLSPRRARPLHMLVNSQSVTGFTLSGRLATLDCVTRPKRVHAFALRLTSSPSRASYPRSP